MSDTVAWDLHEATSVAWAVHESTPVEWNVRQGAATGGGTPGDFQTVGIGFLVEGVSSFPATLTGVARSVSVSTGTPGLDVGFRAAALADVGRLWRVWNTGSADVEVESTDGPRTVPPGHVVMVQGYGSEGDGFGWQHAELVPIEPSTGGGGGASALADLTDVDVETDPPAPDDVLAWDGTNWTPATLDGGSGLELGETSTTAYRGDRGKTAYDHSQVVTGNPHGTTAADVAVDASGFNGNLTTSDDTVQEIAQKLDDLSVGGSVATDAIWDAAGDIVYGTGADTASKLALGTRGKTLMAGASAPEWVAAGTVMSYGGMPAKAGQWQILGGTAASGSTTTFGTTASNSNSEIKFQPFWVGKRIGVSGLALEIGAANDGGSAVLRLGIFSDNDGRPGTIVEQGSASINTATTKEITWTEVFLDPGWYWIGWGVQGLNTSGTNPTFRQSGGAMATSTQSSVPNGSSTQHNQRLRATISGTFASNPTIGTEIGSTLPSLWLKVSTP